MDYVLFFCVRDRTLMSRESEIGELRVLSYVRDEAYDSIAARTRVRAATHCGSKTLATGMAIHLTWLASRLLLPRRSCRGRQFLEKLGVGDLGVLVHGANSAAFLPMVITDNASGQPIAEILYGDGVARGVFGAQFSHAGPRKEKGFER